MAQQQTVCQAHSFQVKAESLEKAAEAHTLQAQAAAHAQAQAQAQATVQQYVAQVSRPTQAYQPLMYVLQHQPLAFLPLAVQTFSGDTAQANAHAQAHQHANAQAVQLETIPSTGTA